MVHGERYRGAGGQGCSHLRAAAPSGVGYSANPQPPSQGGRLAVATVNPKGPNVTQSLLLGIVLVPHLKKGAALVRRRR